MKTNKLTESEIKECIDKMLSKIDSVETLYSIYYEVMRHLIRS